MKSFQKALFDHHIGREGNKLYRADEMEEFCSVHAPGLFDILKKVITSEYSSSLDVDRRGDLKRQRVVAELYRLAYLGNQVKNCKLFKLKILKS